MRPPCLHSSRPGRHLVHLLNRHTYPRNGVDDEEIVERTGTSVVDARVVPVVGTAGIDGDRLVVSSKSARAEAEKRHATGREYLRPSRRIAASKG